MKIKIVITGGTFDKEYDELTGKLFFNDTHMPEMLRLGRCVADLDITTLMMMDSLEMTDEHRKKISLYCKKVKEKHIVITHGTDTMPETAKYLSAQGINKTIVLTGAMVPYKFGSSDGLFNLGSALAFVQALPVGVYVAMNGKCFEGNKVRKNKQKGVFESVKI